MANTRVFQRYRRIYRPLIELIQSLQDIVPSGMELDEKVEVTQVDGKIVDISYSARPVKLVIHDGTRTFILQLHDVDPERQRQHVKKNKPLDIVGTPAPSK